MSGLYTIAILLALIVCSEWLAKKTFLRHLGAALLVILLAAVLANAGAIPSASNATPLYAGIFHYVAPLAIFLLLLQVDLAELRNAGLPMLAAFLLGSAATVIGVVAGLWLTPLGDHLGDLTPALGGMFVGTYTGGSINFNAIALHYQVNEQGAIYAGALAVDNIMTMIWMVVTLLIPRVAGLAGRRRAATKASTEPSTEASAVVASKPRLPIAVMDHIDLYGLSTILALAAGSIWLSDVLANWVAAAGVQIPSILIMTTFALILAQFSVVRRIGGTRILGMLAVYLFLAVIGAHAELAALKSIGSLAGALLAFVSVLLLVHGLIILGVGWFFHDWALIAIASQANIGGATTAMALAETFEREELLVPAILVGSLGTALGTYLGFGVAYLLQ